MPAVDNNNSILNQIKNLIVSQLDRPNKSREKNKQEQKDDRFTKTQPMEKVTYTLEDLAGSDAIKRPIKVNNSNNIFFINHDNRNQALKIEPGEYNLTEIQTAIQKEANEEFGIGEVSLKMTASGSDRFIYAEDKKEENTLDEKG